MRNKLRNMVDRWADAGLVVEFTFIDGSSLKGRIVESDADEAIIEPLLDDGTAGALAVLNLHHVMMTTYTPDDLPVARESDAEPELPPAAVEHLS